MKNTYQESDYNDGDKKYFDHGSEQTVVKIYSGDCYVAKKKGEMLMTILGSCVSACIRDPVTGIGGMNHFLLPKVNHESLLDTMGTTRYGAFAMEKLINEILKLGGRKERLEVKLFGGGNINNNSKMIGDENVKFIKEYVKNENLNVVAEHLGGNTPRRVHFFPDSGKVMIRVLQGLEDMAIVEKEKALQEKVTKTIVAQHAKPSSDDDVTLF